MFRNLINLLLLSAWMTLSICSVAVGYVVESEVIFDNNNIHGVSSNPTADTVFTIAGSYTITYLQTYHWNGGAGTASPGQISLQHSDGTTYGPYTALGQEGYGGASNAYWYIQPEVTIKPGTYRVIDSDPSTWSYNSDSDNQGITTIYGILNEDNSGDDDSADDGTNDTSSSGLITATFEVTEDNIDDFYPVPDFPAWPIVIRRSYDPFGSDSDWLQSSLISSRNGGVRVTNLMLDDQPHWLDLQLDLSHSSLPLNIISMQAGYPESDYPDWGLGSDVVDFRLSSSDIFGPPAYFTLFNVGLDGASYDVDFTYNGSGFAFSGMTPSGFIHYFPSSADPSIGIVTDSATPPVRTDDSKVCFADVPFGAPMALFNVDEPDGEDYLEIDYCSESVEQEFVIRDGIAVGIYAPSTLSGSNASFLVRAFSLSDPFRGTTPEEKMNQCIEKLTRVHIGLAHDNQLTDKLYDMAFAVLNDLNIEGSDTLAKMKTAIVDGKSLWYDADNSGTVKPENLMTFILTTFAKNATPKEHENLAEFFFDEGKIPDATQVLSETAGTVQGQNYIVTRQTLIDLAKGASRTYFPKLSALAEITIEGQKWSVDVQADSDLQCLYRLYKTNKGSWTDTYMDSVMNQNNLDKKIRRKLFEKQKIDKKYQCAQMDEGSAKTACETELAAMTEQQVDWNDINNFTKNLLEDFSAQETQLGALKAELEALNYPESDMQRLDPNGTDCERFKHFYDYVNQAKLDLAQSMGNCSDNPNSSYNQTYLQERAVSMAKAYVNRFKTVPDRKAAYQKLKLDTLNSLGCNQYTYEDENSSSSSGGKWVQYAVYEFVPENHSTECSTSEYKGGPGQWYYSRAGKEECNCSYYGSCGPYIGTGTYTVPGTELIPGETYPFETESRSLGVPAGYGTYITVCYYDKSDGLTYDQENNRFSFQPQSCSVIAEDFINYNYTENPIGSYTAPSGPADGDAVIRIQGGGSGVYAYFMYKWQAGD